ncbi:Attachment invasion locus protein [Xenorhabdus poinarii G6]|uniref:Attachment invasion locus protein n=1 Tax=Xenorhabdus poinarii G6 TaxID=1354304 RepID=A0A068R6F1_9GAMM|nr:Ail/Lom family outer membrane beta-barrel protein [Xenorhabdus poinarii]CDG21695.1 Attachment invasion locus protein [Xenorhabdus poinarii G6]
MKKLVLISLISTGIAFVSISANAAGESTISAGYAQSHVKFDGDKLKENPKGFNVKYRYEFDDHWGVIGSFTYTHQGYEYYHGGHKTATIDLDYYALTAGPVYRINDYVSAYGLIGPAHGKVEGKDRIQGVSNSESKTELAYAAGVQINPIPNVAIDTAYEYSKIGEFKVGTWMVGVGYRF